MPSHSTYRYSPLGRPGCSIRLLRHYRSARDMTMRMFSLETFPVTDCPPFIAMSYTWEPRFPMHHLEIEPEQFLEIGHNLHLALNRICRITGKAGNFRALYSERWKEWPEYERRRFLEQTKYCCYFWIDAICIDQSNIAERNQQIKLMGNIYSDAVSVMVWLGEEEERDPWAIARSLGDFDSILAKLQTMNASKSIMERFFTMDDPSMTLREKMTTLPYWNRLWIIQELMLAQDILVCWGSSVFPWRCRERQRTAAGSRQRCDVCYSAETAEGSHPDEHRDLESLYSINNTHAWGGGSFHLIFDQRKFYERISNRYRLPLDYLIEAFALHECHDPRDKVYGLLGLVDTSDRTRFTTVTADYHRPVEDVYLDVLYVARESPRLKSMGAKWRFQEILRKALEIEGKAISFEQFVEDFNRRRTKWN
ncbi:hypothetical protein NA57DRAFT_56504 [Rhizodiscina lignyota]|uniref:Heterokaryon incompatibility domain-containing protein n=1 Tax=Rhizodiscina lignyota TaxID=1504668 RepID=A0A9P4IIM4_9PEZI|nr:hypothetical protein NA57DRAFT_56504 [Rhizodiscina lignyota]